MPRWLRPKLTRGQVLDLHILHQMLLGDLLTGTADDNTLWEFAAMVLTWSRAAELMQAGTAEIAPLADLSATLIMRWRATGRVELQRQERAVARYGSMVMDAIAEAADRDVAGQAAEWCERRMAVLRELAA
jgi:hypothetical protein